MRRRNEAKKKEEGAFKHAGVNARIRNTNQGPPLCPHRQGASPTYPDLARGGFSESHPRSTTQLIKFLHTHHRTRSLHSSLQQAANTCGKKKMNGITVRDEKIDRKVSNRSFSLRQRFFFWSVKPYSRPMGFPRFTRSIRIENSHSKAEIQLVKD